MKKFFFVGACLLAMLPSAVLAEFSNGVKFGTITKASVSGYFNKSLECTMLLGVDSTPFYIKTQDGERSVNPWHFSGDLVYKDSVNEIAGENAYVEYEQVYFNTGTKYSTEYKIVAVGRTLSPFPEKQCIIEEDGISGKSDGFRIGYIVKASRKGTLVNSWEITLQEGNSGNKFFDMSVDNEKLYEFIFNCVKSGQKVKVLYKDLGVLNFLDPLKDTRYRIVGVIKL